MDSRRVHGDQIARLDSSNDSGSESQHPQQEDAAWLLTVSPILDYPDNVNKWTRGGRWGASADADGGF